MNPILRPRLTAPTFVSLSEPDQRLSVQCRGHESETTPVFTLQSQGRSIPLHSERTPSEVPGETSYRLSADSLEQSGALPGLYDLETRTGSKRYVEPHAVRILECVPQEYCFCLLTDFHLYPPFTSLPFGRNLAHVKKCLAQVMSHQPDFLLFCGDVSSLIFFYPWSVAKMRQILLEQVSCPAFFVPGNHDGYVFRVGGLKWWDGWVYWQRHLGPLYSSFRFGRDHFIGLNTFDWSVARRNIFSRAEFLTFRFRLGAFISDEQVNWLEKDISSAKQQGNRIFFFLHHSPLREQFFRPNGEKLKGTWEGGNRERVLELIRESNPVAVFCGHQHYTQEQTWEGIPFLLTASAASYNEPGYDYVFKKITVSNGTLASVETIPFES